MHPTPQTVQTYIRTNGIQVIVKQRKVIVKPRYTSRHPIFEWLVFYRGYFGSMIWKPISHPRLARLTVNNAADGTVYIVGSEAVWRKHTWPRLSIIASGSKNARANISSETGYGSHLIYFFGHFVDSVPFWNLSG